MIKQCEGVITIKSGKWLPLGRRKEFVMGKEYTGV